MSGDEGFENDPLYMYRLIEEMLGESLLKEVRHDEENKLILTEKGNNHIVEVLKNNHEARVFLFTIAFNEWTKTANSIPPTVMNRPMEIALSVLKLQETLREYHIDLKQYLEALKVKYEEENRTPTGFLSKPYKCERCSKSFEKYQGLRQHQTRFCEGKC